MKAIIFFLSVLMNLAVADSMAVMADEVTYEGTWHTTNRKLDGTLSCVVTELSAGDWRGRFVGTWQGAPFDYTVTFTGPPVDLHGRAKIDGADYTWTGQITSDVPRALKGSFGGSRYTGYFDLKEKKGALK